MADIHTPEQRSYNMSRIKNKWTGPERKLHNILKGNRIKHIMHPKITGSPDVILKDSKTAIFIHGCFWHRCPKCYREPASNRDYWLPKIEGNVRRDRRCVRNLRKNGWKVVTLWEHDFRKKNISIRSIF